jgi:NDP-sugar pyrophosphorylase family protein
MSADGLGTRAVVMAGGSGTRMRASGEATPKPLVRVGGRTLLERNLWALVHHGFRDVVVVVPASSHELQRAARAHVDALAEHGVHASVVVEATAQGNAGGAAAAAGDAPDALVVFADNLTAIDLEAVVEQHRSSAAVLTLAVHDLEVAIPFGVLDVVGEDVTAYREKPSIAAVVASGVAVLGRPAIDIGVARAPCGLVDLFAEVHEHGGRVVAHRHSAPWIDVNDVHAVAEAESLLARVPALAALGEPPRGS